MGRGALIAVLLWSGAALAGEGSLRGTVKLVAVLPDGSRRPLPDASRAVVYVPDFERPAAEDAPHGKIEQKNKQYVPDVLPIVKGQTVDFVNDDPFLHNVFSSSRAAGRSGMDLGKYRGPGRTKSWTFSQAGIVDIYCDIHESMIATVLVLPNSAFVQPGKDGAFQIDHLPPGHHVVYVWARHGQKASADVEIRDGQIATLPPLEVAITPADDAHKDRHGGDYAHHPAEYGN